MTTVEGFYENGHVELAGQPAGLKRAKVYVTFIEEPAGNVRRGGVAQWLEFLREGIALGGPPYGKRDDLYDRGR